MLPESSGDVDVTNTTGRLWVRTTTGGITGAGLRCCQVEVQATSGDIDLGFAAAPRQLTAKTGARNVDIAIPDDDTYRVVVETSAGDTETGSGRIPAPRTPSAFRPLAATYTFGTPRDHAGSPSWKREALTRDGIPAGCRLLIAER